MKVSLILLHGLFGGLSNWKSTKKHFENKYNVFVPQLPISDDSKGNKLEYLIEYLHHYITENNILDCVLIGNSLGGHIAILYHHKYPRFIKGLILTGSSGLFENSMLNQFPRRHDYSYITERVQYTFFDPSTATQSLISDVYNIISDNRRCLQIIKAAKTAQRNDVRQELSYIDIPVLLIWGNQDRITPPSVAKEFHSLIKNSELIYIDECGHAPMMEQPEVFNKYITQYLDRLLTI